MNVFKVNEYITLKLEDKRTNIYIAGRLVNYCKYLLINIDKDNYKKLGSVDSIDGVLPFLDGSHHYDQQAIPPDSEFWGHCSNLQAWAENGYDTRILHSNIAFPLLKELVEAGDVRAKKIFKEEIHLRFSSNVPSVMNLLLEEDYLHFLPDDYVSEVFSNIDIGQMLYHDFLGTCNFIALLEEKRLNVKIFLGSESFSEYLDTTKELTYNAVFSFLNPAFVDFFKEIDISKKESINQLFRAFLEICIDIARFKSVSFSKIVSFLKLQPSREILFDFFGNVIHYIEIDDLIRLFSNLDTFIRKEYLRGIYMRLIWELNGISLIRGLKHYQKLSTFKFIKYNQYYPSRVYSVLAKFAPFNPNYLLNLALLYLSRKGPLDLQIQKIKARLHDNDHFQEIEIIKGIEDSINRSEPRFLHHVVLKLFNISSKKPCKYCDLLQASKYLTEMQSIKFYDARTQFIFKHYLCDWEGAYKFENSSEEYFSFEDDLTRNYFISNSHTLTYPFILLKLIYSTGEFVEIPIYKFTFRNDSGKIDFRIMDILKNYFESFGIDTNL